MHLTSGLLTGLFSHEFTTAKMIIKITNDKNNNNSIYH